ncbi:MAG: preprotein translocase subunit SecY [Candidatus Bilamarchaeaceae archaeon]
MVNFFDITTAITSHLPEIKSPPVAPPAKERLMWTGIALVLYFMMYFTICFGVQHDPASASIDFLQTITASKIGGLLTAGIGPIVFASIFLQLFNGAGLLNIDIKSREGRKKFLEAQKVLAIILAFVEGALFVFGGRLVLISIPGIEPFYLGLLVVFQIALGSIIVIYLDEILTKYGIGSAVSLFIAAGVSYAILSGLVGLVFGQNGVLETVAEGGAEAIPNSILVLLPFLFTILVFLVCVYAEEIKVEIPIAFERIRGLVPKLPLKFFYVSNIPVIFASALLLNIQIFGAALANASLVIPGTDIDIVKIIAYVSPSTHTIQDGILYYITPIYYGGKDTMAHFSYLLNGVSPVYGIPEWVHAITYLLFLTSFSVMFGLFWVDIAGMDAKSVANQLSSSGLQIPGFRRDPRMLESILQKYIYPLTVVGSFSVGLLAGLADLTGALGTGTGILLTVGILYRMYEQMEQMKMFELYPMLGQVVGK